MVVKESDQIIATQIAYANLDEALARLKLEGKEITLINLIEDANKHKDYLNGLKNYLDSNGAFKKEYEHVATWQIIDCKNDNYDGAEYSGFYGCIIDTGDARILACRGSEGMGSFKNLIQDWIKADFGLINSIETDQEKVLREYMRENADLLSEKPWVATGHSLGGALADHAAIVSVEEGIGNFSGVINFDGPGHSQEYINAHMKAIKQVSGKMIHKKASIVGNLLHDFPGVQQNRIHTSNVSHFLDKNGNSEKMSFFADYLLFNFLEHDEKYWILDENENTTTGAYQEFGEWIFEKISLFVDALPAPIGNMIPMILLVAVEGVMWVSEALENNPELKTAIVVAAIGYILTHPLVIPMAIHIVANIIVAVVIILAGKIMFEVMQRTAMEIAKKICNMVSWLSDKTTDLFEAITETINGFQEWLRQKNIKGIAYVQGNPYFKADTDKLREYAARLERVNNRLSKLDSNMRSLYWQVGLLDLWDILLANMITSKSYAINQAKKYLYNTADRFENAENKAKNYIGG